MHIPRCALLYVGAVDLQVNDMTEEIIHILIRTANALSSHFNNGLEQRSMGHTQTVAAVFHLRNALEVAYSHESSTDMQPLRVVLTGVLDALLPFFIGQPVFIDMLSTNVWKKYSNAISADLIKAREARSSTSKLEIAPYRRSDESLACPKTWSLELP